MTSLDVSLMAPSAAPVGEALACLRFDDRAPDLPGVRRIPLRRLGDDLLEVWPASGPVTAFESHGYACTRDGAHLFFWRLDTNADHIEAAAQAAYRDLLALCAESGYPQLLRIWNYFDRLTQGHGDDERYRRFCLGRHHALDAPGFERRLPAATVIGTAVPGLQLFGFASRQPGKQVENPRQTSAFRYPREYGPRSPSFSRATRYGDRLLVSGTAAIVGHQTLHPGQPGSQAQEMLENVHALLGSAAYSAAKARALKLYVRDAADADAAAQCVRSSFGDDAPLLVLQGDVCRDSLVVEMEGVFSPA